MSLTTAHVAPKVEVVCVKFLNIFQYKIKLLKYLSTILRGFRTEVTPSLISSILPNPRLHSPNFPFPDLIFISKSQMKEAFVLPEAPSLLDHISHFFLGGHV
jgi:hypothetical protein